MEELNIGALLIPCSPRVISKAPIFSSSIKAVLLLTKICSVLHGPTIFSNSWRLGVRISAPRYRLKSLPLGSTNTGTLRSEEQTSELQSRGHLVFRLLLVGI